ncbi:hypothetical protein FRB95_000176 [Tulasnella sp. JGI-2019a]|nr:hypothetical protein FRB95_000176 [Tulasnella sp. JGI-2019a]
MHARKHPQASSAQFWKSTTPPAAMDDKTARQAFDNLTTITAAGHAKLTRVLQERYLGLYAWSAWAIGMPRLEVVQSMNAAIVIMNAGGGIGLSLSLEFAEAGYTVFALVHQDLKSSEDGSIGQLLFTWQKRRAAILRRRAEEAHNSPAVASSPLGNVFPLPFRPLSATSREKVHQTLSAYCRSQSLQVHAVILTPVFGMPPENDSPPQRHDPRSDSEDLTASPLKRPRSTSKIEREDDEIDSLDELVSLKALLPLPTVKYRGQTKGATFSGIGEGSYVPLYTANQAVIQRAAQREVTEQLVVAQMFADILVPGKRSPSRDPSRERGPTHSVRRRSSAATKPHHPPPFSRDRRTSSAVPTVSHAMHQAEQGNEDEGDSDSEEEVRVPYGIAHLVWTSMKKKVYNAIPKLPGLKRKRASQEKSGDMGGRLIWVMGAGETSFTGGHGMSGAMDAARESIALSLRSEMATLGVHVSTVTTGPLMERSRRLASPPVSSERGSSYTCGDTHTRRARLLARISSLWAIDEKSCFWIVKQAVEAQYPKRSYSFGLDVLVRKYSTLVPDGVWQTASWVAYERLGISKCEAWLMSEIEERGNRPNQASTTWYNTSKLAQTMPFRLAFGILAKVAQRVGAE